MGLRFTVLASGSAGNANLVQADGFGVLLDAGLGPRQLGDRLRAAGRSWADVGAMLLTHTHTDHWNDRTLSWLARRRLPLYCHAGHHGPLSRSGTGFAQLLEAGLVRPFDAGQALRLAPGLTCRPVAVRHDSGATFGFRLDGPPDLFGGTVAIGYASDLGTWDDAIADHFADVDLLAIEFNHDVDLERTSRRSPMLIARVLGDDGHLSNAQAADLVRAVLARSSAGRLRHLIQLHLSEDCNRPALARQAARVALASVSAHTRVHTAAQHEPGQAIDLERRRGRDRGRAGGSRRSDSGPLLPGMEPFAAAQ